MLSSLPSRERGLKFLSLCCRCIHHLVAPFAGAWIEIEEWVKNGTEEEVAPFAGAWIEIFDVLKSPTSLPESLPSRERGLKSRNTIGICEISLSLPSRERGLKCLHLDNLLCLSVVAPFAGAWIEIGYSSRLNLT